MRFRRDDHHPWIEKLDWEEMDGADLLESVNQNFQEIERPAWVFDLDSTLFCVEPRTRQIYIEFLRRQPNPPKHWWTLLDLLGEHTHAYSVQDMFELAFRKIESSKAKVWAAQLWKSFEPDWMKKFFMGRYVHFDKPYPGAVELVNNVLNQGYDVVYLTGREYLKSHGETYQSLKQSGFPLSPKTRLILKPWQWQHLNDLEYKKKACTVIGSEFNVVCAIDNEPENLIAFSQYFPNAHQVLFHSVMSRRCPSEAEERYLHSKKLIKLNSY